MAEGLPVLRCARLVGGGQVNPLAAFRALSRLHQLLLIAVMTASLVCAFLLARQWLTSTARTEAKLATGQAGAAIHSGQDAATTTGQQARTEAARERAVAEMQKEVNDADDASGAHAAGAGWLCNDFGICAEN